MECIKLLINIVTVTVIAAVILIVIAVDKSLLATMLEYFVITSLTLAMQN